MAWILCSQSRNAALVKSEPVLEEEGRACALDATECIEHLHCEARNVTHYDSSVVYVALCKRWRPGPWTL